MNNEHSFTESSNCHLDDITKCHGCGNEIDPDTCWCGLFKHDGHDGHFFVPIGCTCYKAKKHSFIAMGATGEFW